MSELLFELDTIADAKEGVIKISDYEYSKSLVDQILNNFKPFEITDNDSLKVAKEQKATFNKIIKAIDRKRIDTIDDYVATFKEQCESLKKPFEDRVEELSQKINAFSAKTTFKPTKYSVTVTLTDEKELNKLTEYLKKKGYEFQVK